MPAAAPATMATSAATHGLTPAMISTAVNGSTERKRAVDRQVRKIEHPESEIDAEGDEGVDQPQLHGSPECDLDSRLPALLFCPPRL